MDFLVRQWWIRRTRKSIVRINQQAVDDFRYGHDRPFLAVTKHRSQNTRAKIKPGRLFSRRPGLFQSAIHSHDSLLVYTKLRM
ncbi:hypothetical protein Rcae01_06221 [Novipirellula caenicola]|uniref:Uncharacterized protein n=1 Tax=Novipirellula caenicola TaxID=1536901 RepID=A0ABP9W147_9BACT